MVINLKKLIIIFLISNLLLLLVFPGCTKNTSQTKAYMKSDHFPVLPEKLYIDSNAIITGKVINTKICYFITDMTNNKNKQTEPFYVSTVKIYECIKGSLKKGNTVKIAQWGDNKNNISGDIINSGGYYKKGDQLFLFLYRENNSLDIFIRKNNVELPYTVNAIGQYWFDNKNIIISNTNNPLAENCKTVNDLKNKVKEIASAVSSSQK